jgi:flagellin-like protein
MNFRKLLTEDRAVSPVIGVILMVAITVILAAVIGTFVLGLGDQVSESAPQAQFSFDFSTTGGTDIINVTHDGGDAVTADQLTVNVAGSDAWSEGSVQGSWANTGATWSSDVSAGDTLDLADSSGSVNDGDTVRIIWSSSNSDKTATIGQAEFQS